MNSRSRKELLKAALLCLGVAICGASAAQPEPVGNPFSLSKLRDYKSARVSSESRKDNADMRKIGPGETLTLADIEGPGEITHIWTTIATADPHHLQNIVFRIYWDNNDYPSVESPVGDFFGLGMGRYYMFSNPMQAIGTNKGMNCFWPMPFRKHARVTATNDSDTTVGAYYYYVDYRKYESFPKDVAYFHAQYHQATPNQNGKPYLIMQTDGGRGHFAGVSLSIHTQTPGWWGEGDDIFTVDGEKRPSLWGTGSEDYFCGAWCYGETFYNDYFGMPLREKLNQDADNFWNVYRLHLESPITFEKSLKVEIEHGDNGVSNSRKPRNNNYYSCAYWYVDSPRPLKGKLPPAADRLPRFDPLPVPAGVFEAQYMKRKLGGGEAETQAISRDPEKDGDWINEDQLWVRRSKIGEENTLEFKTTAPLSGEAALYVTRAKDYGTYSVKLDGEELGTIDAYHDTIDRVKVPLGKKDLPAGKHTLTITVTGKNPASVNTFWGIDALKISDEPDPQQINKLPIQK